MRKPIVVNGVISCVAAVLLLAQVACAQDPGWPREMTMQGARLVYYQPQVDQWKDYKDILFRMAFTLTPQGGKEAVGVVAIRAKTQTNVDTRIVVFSNMTITGTYFPSLSDDDSAKMDRLLRTFLTPEYSVTVSLDRVVACTPKPEQAGPPQIKNDPPTIFASTGPAILLEINGAPVQAPITDTSLSFVVNSNWPLFFDTSASRYYLFSGQQWVTASSPDSTWSPASSLPGDMSNLVKDPQWANLKSAIPPPASSGAPPSVMYSNKPAELILFTGKPAYVAIPGTQLSYAANTDSDFFLYRPTKDYYYLTAGRWFRSSGLQGPWSYATASLPADFAKIPHSSPACRVRPSVPGTPEAKDAVLIAQIPTTIVVDPASAAAQAKVTYSGPPDFQPIEGTSLSYAANTEDKVIQVGDLYYLCFQGVWFMSSTPQGPWTTASSVPQEIYTIPPSSPVYNVTYVTQATNDDGNVESSYTAGYTGAFILGAIAGAVLAEGSGYYYPPYYYYPPVGYPVYYPRPTPYGAAAYGRAYYNPYTGTAARTVTAYGPYGSATVARAYNPYTGTYAQGATVSTAYGSRTAASAYNPYTGAAAATRQGSSPYAQWGSSVAVKGSQAVATQHVTTAQGTVASAQTASGGSVTAASGWRGNTAAVGQTASGDMYAGANGNVYKNTGDGWQTYDNGSWSSVDKPTPNASQRKAQAAQTQALNQDYQNRQRGNAQAQQYSGQAAASQYNGARSTQAAQGSGGAFQGMNSGRSAQQFSNRGQSSRSTMQRGGGMSRPSGGGRRR